MPRFLSYINMPLRGKGRRRPTDHGRRTKINPMIVNPAVPRAASKSGRQPASLVNGSFSVKFDGPLGSADKMNRSAALV